MKNSFRWLSLLLALVFCLTAAVGCDKPAPDGEETTEAATRAVTEAPEAKLILDSSYRIIISDEADEMTRKTADLAASAIKEQAGLELSIATDAEAAAGGELVLGHTNRTESTCETSGYAVFVDGDTLHIDASDTTTLYFAAEAVLEAWLTPDFGLTEAGKITLTESRVADLNSLPIRSANSIKIMTQNMRDSDDGDGNTIPKRYDRFMLLLADYQPDIIGTQEHSYSWYLRFQKYFEKWNENEPVPQYGMVGSSVDGHDKKGGGRNVIFYRMDRFELVETETFWLSERPTAPSTLQGTSHKRVCTWALLKDKQTGQNILVANTHLDHTAEWLRVAQINILLEYLADRVGDCPFYMTGDFNCHNGSETYGIITQTMQDSHKTAWADLSTESRTYHGYRERGGMEIDFVFHDDFSTPLRYEILSRDYNGFVSDHYGVMVEFVYD